MRLIVAALFICAIGFFAFLSGCDRETGEEADPGPPKVTFVNLDEGGRLPGNAIIVVTFSSEMEWVKIAVSGADGNVHLSGSQAEWAAIDTNRLHPPPPYDILSQPVGPCYGPMSPGPHTLTITGQNKSGQELEEFKPISFFAVSLDCAPPAIYDKECDPVNGAADVDPQKYSEKLVIKFHDLMAEVKVFQTEPEFPYTVEVSTDATELIISFTDGYTMPEKTRFTIELVGTDRAGNAFASWPKPEVYSFVTMAN